MPPTRPIGLLGGTFDPVHLGHVHLGLSLYYGLELQEVRLIPAARPLLREAPVATPEQRIAMMELAVAGHPGLVVDAREIQRNGPSYTVDTLGELRQEFPATPLCFILSQDQFGQFEAWHRWQEILNLAHLIVAARPGYVFKPNKTLKNLLRERETQDPQRLHTQLAGSIFIAKTIPLAISATEIRAQLQTNATLNYFLTPTVWQYIQRAELYKNNPLP